MVSFKENTGEERLILLRLVHNVQGWVWIDLHFYILFYIYFNFLYFYYLKNMNILMLYWK